MNFVICVTLALFIVAVDSKPNDYRLKVKRRIRQSQSSIFKPSHRENCTSICSDASDYPEEEILQLMAKNRKYLTYFGTVIEPTNQKTVNIASRFGEVEDEPHNMCKTRKHTVFPKKGVDIDNNVRFIVNAGEYVQQLTFETCMSDACDMTEDRLNYKTFCKQEYNIIRLVALKPNGAPELRKFAVPSACVCAYQRT